MRTTALALLFTLPLLALAPARDARADGKKDAPAASKADEASQHFKSGVAFYKERDFAAALVEFKRAYELLPNYNVLYNLGQTARELKDYASALSAFEQYLREGAAKVAPPRRKEVQAAIDELRQKVGKLKIGTSVDGADVLVDDVSVGTSPLAAPITVNVGRRKLSATASGYTPAQRMVDVAGQAETEVTLELTKIGTTTPPPPPPPVEPPKPSIPVAVWASLGATGACAIVAGVTGGLALSARGGLKDELGKFPGNGTAIADAQSKTRTLAVTSDVFTGLSVAGAATTVLLFVFLPRSSSEKPKPTAGVSVSPTGFSVHGAF